MQVTKGSAVSQWVVAVPFIHFERTPTMLIAHRDSASASIRTRVGGVIAKLAASALVFGSITLAAGSAGAATTNLFVEPSSGMPGMESSMAFTPTADPTLYAQLDNQQGSDADSSVFSQVFQPTASGAMNTITWWGTGVSQAGFMVALSDGVWPIQGVSPNLPNSGPVVNGTLVSLSVVPIANVTETPAANGQTKYQITVPSVVLSSSHNYRLSVTSVGGTFQWDIAASGGRSGIEWVRGRAISYLSSYNSAFSLDNVTLDQVAPVVTAQPADQAVSVGSSYSFSAAASGSPAPSVQWQTSTNGGTTWSNVAGATSTTWSAMATAGQVSQAPTVRAVVTNASGSLASNPAALSVSAATKVTLTSSIPRPAVGQKVTLTAGVTPLLGTAKVTAGTVTFSDGATVLGTAPVTAGNAALKTTFASGSHSVTASFSGSGSLGSSTSAPLTFTVAPASTVTSIAAPKLKKHGLPVTISITVTTVKPAVGAPVGSVTLYDGLTPIATLALNAKGKATVTTSSLSVGAHALSVTFSGDANHAPSSSLCSVTIS